MNSIIRVGRWLRLVATMAVLTHGAVAAEDSSGAAAQQTPPAASPADQASSAQLVQQWQQRLDGSQWNLRLVPLSESAGKGSTDTIRFAGRQLTSERLAKEGYTGSNYTMRMDGPDTAIWETMQSREGGGVVFWRGEVHGDQMTGVISKRIEQEPTKDFSFAGNRVGSDSSASPAAGTMATSVTPAPAQSAATATAPPVPAEPAAPATAPAPTAAPQVVIPSSQPPKNEPATPQTPAPSQPKKRRGWFR